MGAGPASTGSGGTGGGTVGPAGVKVDKKGNKKYGTALDAKLTSNRFENNNDNNNGGGVPDALVKIAKLDPAVAKMAAGPTTAEVSQSEAANADADTEANRLLKIKKKGRSQSIISGSQGVTKMAADYSLGKKSLLGRV